jgi:hypothetical protein
MKSSSFWDITPCNALKVNFIENSDNLYE